MTAMANINCLQGIACPKCGNDEQLIIAVHCLADVTDDGAETFGDLEWDAGSYARCPACGHDGTLTEFQSTQTDKETHP